MDKELNHLIETYEIKIKLAVGEQEAMTYNTMEAYVRASKKEERINTKLFCYRTFLTELKKIRDVG
jgi:hypothetical protein